MAPGERRVETRRHRRRSQRQRWRQRRGEVQGRRGRWWRWRSRSFRRRRSRRRRRRQWRDFLVRCGSRRRHECGGSTNRPLRAASAQAIEAAAARTLFAHAREDRARPYRDFLIASRDRPVRRRRREGAKKSAVLVKLLEFTKDKKAITPCIWCGSQISYHRIRISCATGK